MKFNPLLLIILSQAGADMIEVLWNVSISNKCIVRIVCQPLYNILSLWQCLGSTLTVWRFHVRSIYSSQLQIWRFVRIGCINRKRAWDMMGLRKSMSLWVAPSELPVKQILRRELVEKIPDAQLKVESLVRNWNPFFCPFPSLSAGHIFFPLGIALFHLLTTRNIICQYLSQHPNTLSPKISYSLPHKFLWVFLDLLHILMAQKSLVSPRVSDRGPTAGPGLGPLFGGALEVGRLRTGAGPTSAPKGWDFSRSTFVPSMFFYIYFWVSIFCQLSLSRSLSRSTLMYIIYIYIYSIITFFCFNRFGPGNLSWMLCWQVILLEFQDERWCLVLAVFGLRSFRSASKRALVARDILHWDVSKKLWLPLI